MSNAVSLEDVAIRLHPIDNVAVARTHLARGARVSVDAQVVELADPIGVGHKLAIAPIPEGAAVRKYGQIIGFATAAIQPGQHVHVHNLGCHNFERDYAFATAVPARPAADAKHFFDGYLREDGRVGTRNYIAVVSTVNCSASTVHRIVDRFSPERLEGFPNVDGVFGITHRSGCGMAEAGIDQTYLNRCLAGYADHPNVFGYIVVGLGCEVNQPSDLIETHRLTGRPGRQPRILSVQASGGISKSVEMGVRAVEEMLEAANQARRTRQPASKLVLGTNCGGSDAYSGITANPALGVASDRIIAQGGTSILAETTEIYGAEHLLTRRAVSKEVGEKLVERIRWWEWYVSVFGAKINNNPSFGNKEGGLTTIYEKSLGAVAKGGTSQLVDVVGYGERPTKTGLVVMDTPGFDPVSVTGIIAGGANIVVFTTGRGSVFGSKPAPTIKVATNSRLFEHMREDMDFDAGVVLSGESVQETGERLFDFILEVASGRQTKSEQQGLGDDEFAPWIIGPIL